MANIPKNYGVVGEFYLIWEFVMSRRRSSISGSNESNNSKIMNAKRALQIAMKTAPLENIKERLSEIVGDQPHPALALNYFRDGAEVIENPLLSSFSCNRIDVFDFLLAHLDDGINLIQYDSNGFATRSILLSMAHAIITNHTDSLQKITMFNKLIDHEKKVLAGEWEKNILACLDVTVQGTSYNSYMKKFIKKNLENILLERNHQKLTTLNSLLFTSDLKEFIKTETASLTDIIYKIGESNEIITDLKTTQLIEIILEHGYNITALDILKIQEIFSTFPDEEGQLKYALQKGAEKSGLEKTMTIVTELSASSRQHSLSLSRRSTDSGYSDCSSSSFSDTDSLNESQQKISVRSRIKSWKKRKSEKSEKRTNFSSLFSKIRRNRVHPEVPKEIKNTNHR